MSKTHIHHIVPKYMGGSNDSTNLVELSIEEHAQAHKELYEKYGNIQDKIAWLCLSGKTEEGETLRKTLAKAKFQEFLSSPQRKEKWKTQISKTLTGRNLSEKHKESISIGLKKSWDNDERSYTKPPIEVLKQNFENNRDAMAEGRRNSEKWKNFHQDPDYKERKRQQMLGRINDWGDKVSASKKGKATKNTIEVCVNGKTFPSIASAAEYFGIPKHKLRNLYRKFGKFITL